MYGQIVALATIYSVFRLISVAINPFHDYHQFYSIEAFLKLQFWENNLEIRGFAGL
jgi:hypothetical protein